MWYVYHVNDEYSETVGATLILFKRLRISKQKFTITLIICILINLTLLKRNNWNHMNAHFAIN